MKNLMDYFSLPKKPDEPVVVSTKLSSLNGTDIPKGSKKSKKRKLEGSPIPSDVKGRIDKEYDSSINKCSDSPPTLPRKKKKKEKDTVGSPKENIPKETFGKLMSLKSQKKKRKNDSLDVKSDSVVILDEENVKENSSIIGPSNKKKKTRRKTADNLSQPEEVCVVEKTVVNSGKYSQMSDSPSDLEEAGSSKRMMSLEKQDVGQVNNSKNKKKSEVNNENVDTIQRKEKSELKNGIIETCHKKKTFEQEPSQAVIDPQRTTSDVRTDELQGRPSKNRPEDKSIEEVVNPRKKKKKSELKQVSETVDSKKPEDEGDTGSKRKSGEKLEADETVSPNRQSLLSYFTRGEKVHTPKQSKVTLKVEALVHTPPREKKLFARTPASQKKIKKSRKTGQEDPDVICVEELPKIVPQSVSASPQPWKMRISLGPVQASNKEGSDEDSNGNVSECDDITETLPEENNPEVKLTVSTREEVVLIDDSTSSSIKEKESEVVDSSPTSDDVVFLGETQTAQAAKPKLRGGTLTAYLGLKTTPKGKLPKPKISDEQRAARQDFLDSPAPESVRKTLLQPVSEECEGCPAPFPAVSHVRQAPARVPLTALPLGQPPSLILSLPPWSPLLELPPTVQKETLSPHLSTKQALAQLKQEVGVPVKSWHKGLMSMKKKSNEGDLWTERYRPKTASTVLLHGSHVDQLSAWLASRTSTSTGKGDDSSDGSSSEFVTDGDESATSRVGNTALLVGPPGSGKTAAVYAAAAHTAYQVLELNASCNRNGKKVLQEFSEATQSHKVETAAFFKAGGKRKRKKAEVSNNKSLILIEDADVVFSEVDEGLISALNCLQAGSKRPLLLTVSDPSQRHLLRLAPPGFALRLNFVLLPSHFLSCYLRTVAVIEGHAITAEESLIISTNAGNDLRKALMQLQFSASPAIKVKSETAESRSALTCQLDKSSTSRLCRLAKALSVWDIISPVHDVQGEGRKFTLSDSSVLDQCYQPPGDTFRREVADLLCSQVDSALPTVPLPEPRWEECEVEGCLPVSQQLARRAIHCDFLAAVRSIARSERSSLSTHTKRHNRFFSHLASVGLPTAPDLLNSLCSTLCSDSPTDAPFPSLEV